MAVPVERSRCNKENMLTFDEGADCVIDLGIGLSENYSGNSSNPRPLSCTNLLCLAFISVIFARIE